MTSTEDYSVADERAFRALAFQWSVAWDKKNEATLLAACAPQIAADYRDYPAVGTLRHFTAKEFFATFFSESALGDPRLQTQHLLGAASFTRVSDTEALGTWQARARHVRAFPDGKTAEWDSSAYLEFRYVKVDGIWKIGGLRPHDVVAVTGRPQDVIGRFPSSAL